MLKVNKLTTNLWFDTQALEAAEFYISVFKNSTLGAITRYGKAGYEIHVMPERNLLYI